MTKQTRYQDDVLERFIPISLDSLVADLFNSDLLPNDQRILFKQFCTAYIALFHARAHAHLQNLKHIYLPFSPDRETLIHNNQASDEQISTLKTELFTVLENANYERLSEDDLNEALNKISPHGVKVSVDFDEFEEVALFYRGSAIQTESRKNWKQIYLKEKTIETLIYRRLFVLLQPKNRQQWIQHHTESNKLSTKKAEKKADEALKTLGVKNEQKIIYLKLFKDIPRADLEMLFPNTRIQIRLFDKIKLGVMGGGGTAGGIMATITKFSAAIEPLSALLAVAGLLGVIWRQISKIFSQRAKYSAILTKNLYFYSLDNNMGALTYLADLAESEECKEAILAYFFLTINGSISRTLLDQKIEHYILQQYDIPMDFEINDGLDKLQEAELLSEHDDSFNATPLSEATLKLKQQWNNLIENN